MSYSHNRTFISFQTGIARFQTSKRLTLIFWGPEDVSYSRFKREIPYSHFAFEIPQKMRSGSVETSYSRFKFK